MPEQPAHRSGDVVSVPSDATIPLTWAGDVVSNRVMKLVSLLISLSSSRRLVVPRSLSLSTTQKTFVHSPCCAFVKIRSVTFVSA